MWWPAPIPWPPSVWPICSFPRPGWPSSPSPPAEKPWRRVRIETGVGGDLMRRSRPRIRFAQKVGEALMEEAVASLAQAKAMHDDLEAIYHPYVDFSLVDRTAQELAQTILKK